VTQEKGLDELLRREAILPDQGPEGGRATTAAGTNRRELGGRGWRGGGEVKHGGPDKVSLQVDSCHSTL
jgi:hypothetical protein